MNFSQNNIVYNYDKISNIKLTYDIGDIYFLEINNEDVFIISNNYITNKFKIDNKEQTIKEAARYLQKKFRRKFIIYKEQNNRLFIKKIIDLPCS